MFDVTLKRALKICFQIVRLSYHSALDSALSILSPTTKLKAYFDLKNFDAGRWVIIILKTLHTYNLLLFHSFIVCASHLKSIQRWSVSIKPGTSYKSRIFLMTNASHVLFLNFFTLATTFSSVSGAKHSMNVENAWSSQFVKWILNENLRVVLFVATIEQCDNAT